MMGFVKALCRCLVYMFRERSFVGGGDGGVGDGMWEKFTHIALVDFFWTFSLRFEVTLILRYAKSTENMKRKCGSMTE